MRSSYLIFLFLVPMLVTGQDFIMQAGSQKILTPEERTLSLTKLILGDNVTIIIPATMNGWTVTASDATIGANVKIIANGVPTYPSSNGGQGANAAVCMKGMNGANGAYGANGLSGKNVSLNLKIRRIGSLNIFVSGTNGVNGGHGGNGGSGGNSTCNCNAGAGGNGGSGGAGGNGGNGGNVSITFSKIGKAQVTTSNFIVENTGGTAGMGGNGGAAGPGGRGGGCQDSKATAKPQGFPGIIGARGANGIAGKSGTTTLISH